jgi:two-component system, sensor histidine kinase and response regulator
VDEVIWTRRVERERRARKEAEALLESKSYELWKAHQALESANKDLEERVLARTLELEASKDAAESASRAKSAFLANMSHELRTPMNGVIGMTQLAIDTVEPPIKRGYLTTAKESAYGLLELLNQILDFSKIESGKMELTVQPFSLRKCVSEALRSTAMSAHAKSLAVVCDIPEEVPDSLAGDSLRVRQILVNLLGNAIKFTDRGQVELTIALASCGSLLEISVRDTGIGIPQDMLTVIFDSFHQVEQSTTRRFGGTGLGLAISRDLCSEMGGIIEAESEVDKGSLFRIKLPLVESESKPDECQRGLLSKNARRGPILLVTRTPVVGRSIQRMLTAWGARVLVASEVSEVAAIPMSTRRSITTVIAEADIEAEMQRAMDTTLDAGEHVMWIFLQLTTGHREGGIPDQRCKHLVLPIIGESLRHAIEESSPPGAPLPSQSTPMPSLEKARDAFGLPPKEGPKTRRARYSRSILVVEDNLVNQRVARLLLESWGHHVTIAENGLHGLIEFEKQSFDIVLMDMQMPVMDGLTASRTLREREQDLGATATPIIAMTANAMKGDDERCYAAGMSDYISKPIDANLLFAMIESTETAGSPR